MDLRKRLDGAACRALTVLAAAAMCACGGGGSGGGGGGAFALPIGTGTTPDQTATPDSGTDTGARALQRIEIVPNDSSKGNSTALTTEANTYVGLSAKGYFSDKTSEDITAHVTWTTSTDLVATIDDAGTIAAALRGNSAYLVPPYPQGLSSGQATITARDKQTGIEGNNVLTVNRGRSEGHMDFPMALDVLVGGSPPGAGIPGRNSFASNTSWYRAKLDPAKYYAFSLRDWDGDFIARAGGCTIGSSAASSKPPMGCIGKSDDSGDLDITVLVPSVAGTEDLAPTVNYKIFVQEAPGAPYQVEGTLVSPKTVMLPEFLQTATGKCSYYSVATPQTGHAYTLSFSGLYEPAFISVNRGQAETITTDVADGELSFTAYTATSKIDFCNTALFGFGNRARFELKAQ